MKNHQENSANSATFKKIALEKLKGNWVNAIFVCIIFSILTNGLNLSYEVKNYFNYGFNQLGNYRTNVNVGSFLNLIFGGALSFGLVTYFLNLFRTTKSKIEDVFSGFSYFGKTFILNLLIQIFVLLWLLLLIIPGIIAIIKYSMSFYILHDYPELSALEAIERSKEMMNGNKLRLFNLWLSFLGWFILGVLSFGIGFIWISPYYNAAKTAFYEDLKSKGNL